MNAEGGLRDPEGITVNSYVPYLVLITVLCMPFSLPGTRSYLDRNSMHENTLALMSLSNISSIPGTSALFFFVFLSKAQ